MTCERNNLMTQLAVESVNACVMWYLSSVHNSYTNKLIQNKFYVYTFRKWNKHSLGEMIQIFQAVCLRSHVRNKPLFRNFLPVPSYRMPIHSRKRKIGFCKNFSVTLFVLHSPMYGQ